MRLAGEGGGGVFLQGGPHIYGVPIFTRHPIATKISSFFATASCDLNCGVFFFVYTVNDEGANSARHCSYAANR